MHEFSLARDLLSAMERNLDRSNSRVVRVAVIVGSAAGISSGSLRFAFRVISEGTRMEGAELSITTIAARSRCADCGIVFDFDGLSVNAPVANGSAESSCPAMK